MASVRGLAHRSLTLLCLAALISAGCDVQVSTDLVPRSPEQIKADLREDLQNLVGAIETYREHYQQDPLSDAEQFTVGQLYEAMQEQTGPAVDALDDVAAEAQSLQAAMNEAVEADVDIGVSEAKIEQFTGEFNTWLRAHREQADPTICRDSIPSGASDDPFEVWAEEWSSCFLDFMSSDTIREGLEAAEAINRLMSEFATAWS